MSTIKVPRVRNIGPPRLTAGFDRFPRVDYRAHLEIHGDLPRLTTDDVLTLTGLTNLRGKGGAGFPFARKVQAVVDAAQRRQAPVTVVVNATEGEPGSQKDKALLIRAPHLIIDGAELAARTLSAQELVIGVAHGGPGERSLLKALKERLVRVPVRVVRMPDRFISGEGGALVRGINGENPIPPGRKQRAAERGVGGNPTLLSNAETYSQFAVLARSGADLYSSAGTPDEPGTVMLTVGGDARSPAVVEAPAGVPLSAVLDLCKATPGQGVIVGGYHGKWINPVAAAQATLSRAGMEKVGGTLGAGIILPMDNNTCPLGEVHRVVRYMAGESAGQCGPCVSGLADLDRTVLALIDGTDDGTLVRQSSSGVVGRGACAHPDGVARFAVSAVDVFGEDIAVHAREGSCGRPVRGVLPLPGADGDARLLVDWSRCEGHGLCAEIAPDLVRLDRYGYPKDAVMGVQERFEPEARKAVEMCPALALRLDGVQQKK